MKINATRGRASMVGTSLALLLVACGSDLSTGSSAKESLQNSDSFNATDLLRPPVPVDSLKIVELTAVNTQSGSRHLMTLTFSPNQAADYAEIQYCTQEKCEPLGNSVTNSIELPPIPEGPALAKARACMLSARVLPGQENCGEWSEAEFVSPQWPNAATIAAIDARDAKKAEIFDLSLELKAALEQFNLDSERCLTVKKAHDRIMALRGLTAKYLSLGEVFIELSIKRHNEKAGQKDALAGGTPVEKVAEPISKESKKLEKFEKYNAAVRNFAKARDLFDEAKPVPALQTLGLAMFDLFLAPTESETHCLAEAKAKLEISAIKFRVDEVNAQIESLNESIQEGTSP